MFNMLIIFILDALFRRTDMYKTISLSNWIAGFYAILLMIAVMFAFVLDIPRVGGFSIISIVIFCLYLLSSYSTFRASGEGEESSDEDSECSTITMKKALIMFFIFAAIIVVAGLVMSKTADGIADKTGLGKSFVGSFLLAIVTSLPELSACYAAVRIGSVNMAIGGLFGSNVFNMTIISVTDFVYIKQPIFSAVSPDHLASAIFAASATVIALLGMKEANTLKIKLMGISIHSYAIFGLYIFYMTYMYSVR